MGSMLRLSQSVVRPLIVLVAFGAGLWAGACWRDRGRLRERDALQHAADSTRLTADSLRAAVAAYTIQNAITNAQLTQERLRARGRAQTTADTLTAILGDSTAPDTCQYLLRRMRVVLALHLAADTAERVAADSQVSAATASVAFYYAAFTEADSLQRVTDGRLQRALGPIRPSRFGRGVLVGAAAVGIVALLTR